MPRMRAPFAPPGRHRGPARRRRRRQGSPRRQVPVGAESHRWAGSPGGGGGSGLAALERWGRQVRRRYWPPPAADWPRDKRDRCGRLRLLVTRAGRPAGRALLCPASLEQRPINRVMVLAAAALDCSGRQGCGAVYVADYVRPPMERASGAHFRRRYVMAMPSGLVVVVVVQPSDVGRVGRRSTLLNAARRWRPPPRYITHWR